MTDNPADTSLLQNPTPWQTFSTWIEHWQQQQQALLAAWDDTPWQHDHWEKHTGFAGTSKVLTAGPVIEKAAINISRVQGDKLPAAATAKRPHLADQAFQACGVSLIVHPYSPFIPSVHANFRYFSVADLWWMGGGADLTPYFGVAEDAILWHQGFADTLRPFDPNLYPSMRQHCDDYFFLPHRQEPRGIGGIFFDDFQYQSFTDSLQLLQALAAAFSNSYHTIVAKHINQSFSTEHRAYQAHRRGRYVEFNLLYDRGTLFGLQSQGRIESILASLPPHVAWTYQYQSPDQDKIIKFLTDKTWIKKVKL